MFLKDLSLPQRYQIAANILQMGGTKFKDASPENLVNRLGPEGPSLSRVATTPS